MKILRISKFVLSNLCIICSLVLLTVCVLEWYNPYMDFLVHTFFVLYILCFSAIILGVENILLENQGFFPGEKRKKRHHLKYSERRNVKC